MLEPLLPHNRKAFDRLRRTQILGLIPVGVCTVVLILLLPRSSAEYVVLLFYAVIIGGMGLLEIKKTLVYRRDLRERRESSDDVV